MSGFKTIRLAKEQAMEIPAVYLGRHVRREAVHSVDVKKGKAMSDIIFQKSLNRKRMSI